MASVGFRAALELKPCSPGKPSARSCALGVVCTRASPAQHGTSEMGSLCSRAPDWVGQDFSRFTLESSGLPAQFCFPPFHFSQALLINTLLCSQPLGGCPPGEPEPTPATVGMAISTPRKCHWQPSCAVYRVEMCFPAQHVALPCS